MPFIKTDVDSQRALSKLDRAETLLDAGTGSAIKQVGEYIKNIARLEAPRHTGDTMRAIIKRQRGRKEVSVISQDTSDTARFNLPEWMHESAYAEKHIKTGNRKYMYAARRRGRQRADDIVEKNVTELLARID